MRHGTSSRRQRSRGNGGRRGGNQKTKVFDSNGPDVRIRGTAYQVVEKYLALAKDAVASDDRVIAESYFQHAEHYQRVINEWSADSQDQNTSKRERAPRSGDQKQNADSDDGLALPASILGEGSKASSQGAETRTAELSTTS